MRVLSVGWLLGLLLGWQAGCREMGMSPFPDLDWCSLNDDAAAAAAGGDGGGVVVVREEQISRRAQSARL